MYIFAYACACVCTSSADRLRSYQPISFFKNYSTRFPSKNPTPLHPSFLSMGSIRHLVFFTSLTTRENERIIGQGTRVRSHMAPRFFQTFRPILLSPILGKENCPKIADRRAIAAMGKPSSFFFFFFTLIHERKKRKECTSEIFQFFRSKIGRKRIQKRSRMYPARKCDRSAEL